MKVSEGRRRSSGGSAPNVRYRGMQVLGLAVLGMLVTTTLVRYRSNQARSAAHIQLPTSPAAQPELFTEVSAAIMGDGSSSSGRQAVSTDMSADTSTNDAARPSGHGTLQVLQVGQAAAGGGVLVSREDASLVASNRPQVDTETPGEIITWKSPPPPLSAEEQAKALLAQLQARKEEMDKAAAQRLTGKSGVDGLSILDTTEATPYGPKAPEENPLCVPFLEKMPRTVALVGNGPLTEPQRREIEACDVVMRFNLLNNWRRFLERVDIWVIRFSADAKQHYWGINNLTPAEALGVFRDTKGVWLVGGSDLEAIQVAAKFPELGQHHLVLLKVDDLSANYQRNFKEPKGFPSTGFIGISATLLCTPATTQLHIFGMNWSDRNWPGHKVDKEQAFVGGLEATGRVVIHPTPCDGMRECGPKDLDVTCHWASDGRYMCLRGHPRVWKDFTHLLDSGRKEDFFSLGEPPATSNTSHAS